MVGCRLCYFFAGRFQLFLCFSTKPQNPVPLPKYLPHDVNAPQSNKAMITLANGQRYYLDSAGNGALAMQGNVQLVKLANGKIAYQAEFTGSRKYKNGVQYLVKPERK